MAEVATEPTFDIRVYLSILLKYKWAILSMALLAAVVGLYLALKAVPIYSSSAKLQIERTNQNAIMGAQFGAMMYDFEFYETQYQLIKSWGVAELLAW